ncbi:MAG: hypothetical protein AB9903_18285 [Vulcanimicrobiota bacterium]
MLELFFFIIFFGIVGLGLYVSYQTCEKQKAILRSFASSVELGNVEMGGSFLVPAMSGSYKGKNIKIEIRPGGKNSPPYMYVWLYTNSQFNLNVYPEGALQKLGKNLGLVNEIQIDIPEFDEKFVIKADQAALATKFLSSEINRKIIESLLSTGFPSVDIRRSEIEIYKPTSNVQNDVSTGQLQPVLDGLVALSLSL